VVREISRHYSYEYYITSEKCYSVTFTEEKASEMGRKTIETVGGFLFKSMKYYK